MEKIIIDEDNAKYLIRKDFEGYCLSLYMQIPRKSKKGYLGMKKDKSRCVNRIRIQNREGALALFYNWKEEFLPKYIRKEILSLYINLYPIYKYYVTCPICKKDATIIDFITMMGTEMEAHFPIQCPNCAKDPENIMTWVTIGECHINAIDRTDEEKEQEISLIYSVSNIKYDDFIKNSAIIEKK